jgi:hypothetical protein
MRVINKYEYINMAYNKTQEFINKNNKLLSEGSKFFRAYYSLIGLIPQTLDRVLTGHAFPFIESYQELENSYQLCCFGFYKYSYISLRSVCELGLLSVYWDKKDKSHIDIEKWLNSKEDTPFKGKILNGLNEIENFRNFPQKKDLEHKIDELYKELSGFVHTKGYHFSSRAHNKINHNTFNESAFYKWFNFMKRVIQILIIIHLLKYPIGLQYTPMENKYGLNGPMGGFLHPDQSNLIRDILDRDILEILQEISNKDSEAISFAEAINRLPDISEEDLKQQCIDDDKRRVSINC